VAVRARGREEKPQASVYQLNRRIESNIASALGRLYAAATLVRRGELTAALDRLGAASTSVTMLRDLLQQHPRKSGLAGRAEEIRRTISAVYAALEDLMFESYVGWAEVGGVGFEEQLGRALERVVERRSTPKTVAEALEYLEDRIIGVAERLLNLYADFKR
jgi:hypothetical protein